MGVAACVIVGCSSDDNNYTDQPQPQQQESRNTSSRDVTASMAFPTGNRNSSQLLVEEMAPREVRVGRPYTYRLRVTNLTNQRLSDVVLRQKIPADLALANEGPGAQQASYNAKRDQNGQARFDVGDLGPNQSKTIEVTGTPGREGQIDTCLSAQFNPPTLCAVVMAVAPALRIQAYAQPEADICQDITERYTVTNTGTGTAHNVVLRADLPNGLETTEGQRKLETRVGDLGQGQSKEVMVRLRARQAGRFTARVVADSDIGQVQAEEVNTVVRAPRLAVTIVAPKEQYSGDEISYRVTVKNNGDAAARDTRLRFGATPGMVEFMSAEGAEGRRLSSEHQNGGQNLGTIAPGEARNVMVHFRTLRGGQVTVDATAEAQCAAPVTTPIESEIHQVSASALIVTHDHDPVRVGDDVTYHIVVQNKGHAADHDVVIVATLPDGEQFVGVEGAGGRREAKVEGQTISLGAIPTLEPKQTISWDIKAKALRPGEVQLRVTMTSETTTKPAVKIEPTKLIGAENNLHERTNEAPPVPQNQ